MTLNQRHLSISAATSTIALVAIANLSGRLVLGILSDRIARINVITIALTICLIGVSLLLFFPLDDVSFYASIACVVFTFGGTITLFPSLVSGFSATFYLVLTMIAISIVNTFIIKLPTKESVTMFDNNMPCPA